MSNQSLFEAAFENRDIKSLRELNSLTDVDHSYRDNFMPITIIKEGLHTNYLKLFNCKSQLELQKLTIFAIKNNSYDMFRILEKKIDYQNIFSEHKYNFFLELAKLGDKEITSHILSKILKEIQEDNTNKLEVLNYVKDGIIFIIHNFSFSTSNFIEFTDYCYSFHDFVFIREILNISNKSNRLAMLKRLSKLHQIIDLSIDKDVFLDAKFIEKYVKNPDDIPFITPIIYNTSLQFIYNNNNQSQPKKNNIYLTELSAMVSENNKYYTLDKQHLTSALIDSRQTNINNIIIELLKSQDFHFVHLKSILFALNIELFDFVFSHFELLNLNYGKSTFELLNCLHFISIKNNSIAAIEYNNKTCYIISKLMLTKDSKDFFSLPNNIIIGLQKRQELFEYILSQNTHILDVFSSETNIISMYKIATKIENNKLFKILIDAKLGFKFCIQNIIKGTQTFSQKQKYHIVNASNIYNF